MLLMAVLMTECVSEELQTAQDDQQNVEAVPDKPADLEGSEHFLRWLFGFGSYYDDDDDYYGYGGRDYYGYGDYGHHDYRGYGNNGYGYRKYGGYGSRRYGGYGYGR